MVFPMSDEISHSDTFRPSCWLLKFQIFNYNHDGAWPPSSECEIVIYMCNNFDKFSILTPCSQSAVKIFNIKESEMASAHQGLF